MLDSILSFKEYCVRGDFSNKGLFQSLYDLNYKHTCVKPEKMEVYPFAKSCGIKTPELLHTGNINDLFPEWLPGSYCLKPVDGAGSRGVFLMHNGVNLKDGKVYSEQDIRESYLIGSTRYVGYSHNYYIEELLLDNGRIPDDYNFFMIENNVGCVLRIRKFMTDRVTRIFYDETGQELGRSGDVLLSPGEQDWEAMRDTALQIMGYIKNPVMRVDLYCVSGRGVFLGEMTAASGIYSPEPSPSFTKIHRGLDLDKYSGYLLSQVDLSKYDGTWRLKDYDK